MSGAWAYCASLTCSLQVTGLPLSSASWHRDVRHEAVRRGAMPVLLAGLEEDAVAGPDHLDRPAFALAEADALGDPDRLAARMGVPGGARAGREVDGGGAEAPVALGRGDRVDVDRAGEPVGRPRCRSRACFV